MKIQDFSAAPVDALHSGAALPTRGYRRQRLDHVHKAASVRTDPRPEYFKPGFTVIPIPSGARATTPITVLVGMPTIR